MHRMRCLHRRMPLRSDLSVIYTAIRKKKPCPLKAGFFCCLNNRIWCWENPGSGQKNGGVDRSRTDLCDFADRCLTVWLPRLINENYSILYSTFLKKQLFSAKKTKNIQYLTNKSAARSRTIPMYGIFWIKLSSQYGLINRKGKMLKKNLQKRQ